MTPKLKTQEKEAPVVAQPPAVVKLLLEQIVTREAPVVAPHGWEFLPERDQNGLIVRVVALPLK